MNKKVTRKGSGRTKGSVSFISVPLGELCAKIADPKTPIKVSRIQMEAMGFQPKADAEAPKALEAVPAAKPVTKVTDFDDEKAI